MNEQNNSSVNFASGKMLPIAGLIAGVIIAVLTPAIILKFGTGLTPTMQFVLIIVCVAIGGFVALVAAFFGTVIPSSVPYRVDSEKTSEATSNQP